MVSPVISCSYRHQVVIALVQHHSVFIHSRAKQGSRQFTNTVNVATLFAPGSFDHSVCLKHDSYGLVNVGKALLKCG